MLQIPRSVIIKVFGILFKWHKTSNFLTKLNSLNSAKLKSYKIHIDKGKGL